MKNVLFATTALVAFAGAAAAQEITWSGSMTAGYNDGIGAIAGVEGGLFWDASLSVDASVDLGDTVTASVEWKVLTLDEAGVTMPSSDVPTATIAFDNGTLSAKLIAGDQDDKGAGEMWYTDRSGMAMDISNWDNAGDDFTAIVEFGNFGVAATTNGGGTDTSYGAKAAFGSIEIGLGYDNFASGNSVAISADATFGAMTVGVSYATGTVVKFIAYDGNDADPLVFDNLILVDTYTETSTGVSLDYDISDSISVGAYYASNTVAPNSYGVSADFSAGAFSVSAYYDVTGAHAYVDDGTGVDGDGDGSTTAGGQFHDNTTKTSFGADLSYDVSDSLTGFAGVQVSGTASVEVGLQSASATTYYVGVEYTVNDNVSATVSYATADEISGPKFKSGISAFITASF